MFGIAGDIAESATAANGKAGALFENSRKSVLISRPLPHRDAAILRAAWYAWITFKSALQC
jgi:hypothetical protein